MFSMRRKKNDKSENKPETMFNKTDTIIGLDSVTNSVRNICMTLESINFDKVLANDEILNARIPYSYSNDNDSVTYEETGKDVVIDIKNKVRFFIMALNEEDSTKVASLSTEKYNIQTINNELFFFAQNLVVSLNTADLITAQACIMGLGYGVAQAHNPIPESNLEFKEVEMEKRFKKIQVYRSIVLKSQEIHNNYKQVDKYKKQHDETESKYHKAYDELDIDKKKYPERYQKIRGLSGQQAAKLSADDLEAFKKQLRVQNLYNTGDKLTKLISLVKTKIEASEAQISNLKIAATSLDYEINDELQISIEKAFSYITSKQADMQNDIITQQLSLDELTKEFDATLNDTSFRKLIAKVSIASDKIKQREIEKQEENDKAEENLNKAVEEELKNEEEKNVHKNMPQKHKKKIIASH